MTIKERAEIAGKIAKRDFCTHYPGYICGKGFPAACVPCISSWIIRNGITQRDDPRISGGASRPVERSGNDAIEMEEHRAGKI